MNQEPLFPESTEKQPPPGRRISLSELAILIELLANGTDPREFLPLASELIRKQPHFWLNMWLNGLSPTQRKDFWQEVINACLPPTQLPFCDVEKKLDYIVRKWNLNIDPDSNSIRAVSLTLVQILQQALATYEGIQAHFANNLVLALLLPPNIQGPPLIKVLFPSMSNLERALLNKCIVTAGGNNLHNHDGQVNINQVIEIAWSVYETWKISWGFDENTNPAYALPTSCANQIWLHPVTGGGVSASLQKWTYNPHNLTLINYLKNYINLLILEPTIGLNLVIPNPKDPTQTTAVQTFLRIDALLFNHLGPGLMIIDWKKRLSGSVDLMQVMLYIIAAQQFAANYHEVSKNLKTDSLKLPKPGKDGSYTFMNRKLRPTMTSMPTSFCYWPLEDDEIPLYLDLKDLDINALIEQLYAAVAAFHMHHDLLRRQIDFLGNHGFPSPVFTGEDPNDIRELAIQHQLFTEI